MDDIEENVEKGWVKALGIGLLVICSATVVGTITLVYKIAKGIYTLLDKLIDKI